jgi:hypothetical protein
MEVSGQRHAPGTIHPGKEAPIYNEQERQVDPIVRLNALQNLKLSTSGLQTIS